MHADPCFRCVLPDCDEGDSRCRVRRLQLMYQGKRRRGLMHLVTAEERAANSHARRIQAFEHEARLAEGVL